MRAIGLISGTSMDGIDVALIDTDGESQVTAGAVGGFPYGAALRAQIAAVVHDPTCAEHDALADLDRAVTEANAQAVEALIARHGIDRSGIDVIGLHGQTILHRPERRFTRQLGDGMRLAAMLGIDVVSRFRHADVAAGGQGAPFAPLYHAALAAPLEKPLVVLNLGGVGNVTYIDANAIIAFDTGPANALLDDWALKHTGTPCDVDGRLARTGAVDDRVLAQLLDHPYWAAKPPKSLDRNDFHRIARAVEGLTPANGAATLLAFTVKTVAASRAHLPSAPSRWLVTGGGRHNSTMMAALAAELGAPVAPVESVGWNGDMLEAQCFAYLAVRSLRGLPLSLPTTTGVPRPMTGGELSRAPRRAA
jgi:anhydro-N-acetylmuramic acid kinase